MSAFTVTRFLRACFPSDWNPLYHLGALGFYLFWLVAITGVYLFVFFETSVTGAWNSVESISLAQFHIGSVVRGIHRYASAAMAVAVTLHLLRELVLKRFRGARRFSWISGIPLLWLLFASAIGGYALVWDERAQYVMLATARLFDSLPVVVEPMAFGLADNAAVNNRLFTLLIFLHVGLPLALLLGMFIHIARIAHARAFPARGLAGGVLLTLIVLSVVKPARSLAPANFDAPLHEVQIDWFYMNIFPLMDSAGPAAVWLLLTGFTAALLALPLLVRERTPVIARVDPNYCNGCGWCFQDCPFDAILMKDHDFLAGHQQSVVIADKCVGCGICAGACPTATPFKSVNKAYSGINLDNESNAAILLRTIDAVGEVPPGPRILVAGCAHGPALAALESADTRVVTLECAAQLPPSYLDYLCRREAVDAVVLTGCAEGDCYHRLGIELQEARLAHEREPHLRFRDVAVRVSTVWGADARVLESHLNRLRANLHAPVSNAATGDEHGRGS